MKRLIILFAVLAVGVAAAGWRGRFDDQFAAALNAGTPIPAVAWYKLDGDALDSSGNGYDGTWAGTEAYTNGLYAGTQAAWFGGGASHIGTALTNLGVAAKTNMTVTFWVRASPQYWAGFVSKYRANTNQREWWLSASSASPYAAIEFTAVSDPSNYNTRKTVRTGDVLSSDTFIHVAAVFNSANMLIFVNGVGVSVLLVADGFAGTEVPSTDAPVGIARRAVGESYLIGTVDDVRIFDRALSPANIARIMESQDNEPIEELQ